MRPLLLLPVLLPFMTTQTPAQMPENYVIDTTADLVTLCSVEPSDPEYVSAIHFCHGSGAGAVQYHLIQVQAMPDLRMFCVPAPPPTRAEAWSSFLAWIDQNPGYLDDEALDAVFAFLAETYPCS